jgi:predicted phage-related endonuclease
MTVGCSVIPSQQPYYDLYIPVTCSQQVGTDRYAEAETYSPQIQHKEYSEYMLAKENLMMKKRLKALKEFKTSIENRIIYRLFSQTNYCCESKLNAR